MRLYSVQRPQVHGVVCFFPNNLPAFLEKQLETEAVKASNFSQIIDKIARRQRTDCRIPTLPVTLQPAWLQWCLERHMMASGWNLVVDFMETFRWRCFLGPKHSMARSSCFSTSPTHLSNDLRIKCITLPSRLQQFNYFPLIRTNTLKHTSRLAK